MSQNPTPLETIVGDVRALHEKSLALQGELAKVLHERDVKIEQLVVQYKLKPGVVAQYLRDPDDPQKTLSSEKVGQALRRLREERAKKKTRRKPAA